MATSLFKMPFDIEKTKIRQIYRSEELEKAQVETITCDEMKQIYGEHTRAGSSPARSCRSAAAA